MKFVLNGINGLRTKLGRYDVGNIFHELSKRYSDVGWKVKTEIHYGVIIDMMYFVLSEK